MLVGRLKSWAMTSRPPRPPFTSGYRCRTGVTSMGSTTHLLEQGDIQSPIPGNGLGEPGKGYVRLALTVPQERAGERP